MLSTEFITQIGHRKEFQSLNLPYNLDCIMYYGTLHYIKNGKAMLKSIRDPSRSHGPEKGLHGIGNTKKSTSFIHATVSHV